MNFEDDYKNLIRTIIYNGDRRQTRAGETLSLFGKTLVIDELEKGFFPLITARRMFYAGIIGEMAAFLHGPKCLKDFESRGCNYWANWAEPDGSINIDYGNAWLDWNGLNQIEDVIDKLKNDPNDRRMIITGWDPANLKNLSLPCCHLLYQFYVRDGKVDMMWYQRSADIMIGVPSDFVLAALFLIYMADAAGLEPGRITMVFGDTHIYTEHLPNVFKYLETPILQSPTYAFDGDIRTFEPHNFRLDGYTFGPRLNFKLLG